MTTSIPPSTTFLPAKPALLVAAKVDLDAFKRRASAALETAGFVGAALTLEIGTWPVHVWCELASADADPLVVEARDLMVALSAAYKVSFEWDDEKKRMVVVRGGKDVGTKMVPPPSLLKRLRRQQDEEDRRGKESIG